MDAQVDKVLVRVFVVTFVMLLTLLVGVQAGMAAERGRHGCEVQR